MKYISRVIEKLVLKASRNMPAVIVTGPRRSGKTTLLRKLFPKATYYLLEDPDIIGRVKLDPKGFLDEVKTPVIFDEIQNTPELFNYIRTLIDLKPERSGQWLFTGSQEAPLMLNVSESMSGRAAIFQLLPMSLQESEKVSLLKGGFAEVIKSPSFSEIWFRSYIQTYLERDVRAISSIKNLSTFRRFLALLASRCGQILNKTDIASPLGVSVPTVSEWLSILEITGQIIIVPPFYENFGKRLIKSPRVYFTDSGMICHLLGLNSRKALLSSTFLGSIFEGFVASEIIKYQINSCKGRGLYYFRDQQGLEVDFLIYEGGNNISLLEVKSSCTPKASMSKNLNILEKSISRYNTKKIIVHLATKKRVSEFEDLTVMSPGVKAMTIGRLIQMFSKS